MSRLLWCFELFAASKLGVKSMLSKGEGVHRFDVVFLDADGCRTSASMWRRCGNYELYILFYFIEL